MTTPNYFDHAGAIKLKDCIERYWSARGYHVNVELIEARFSNQIRSNRFDVRSDMVNGMPRHKPVEAVRRYVAFTRDGLFVGHAIKTEAFGPSLRILDLSTAKEVRDDQ